MAVKAIDKRYLELTRILESGRNKVAAELAKKAQDIRESGSSWESNRVGDEAEQASRDDDENIEFALLDMKSDMLGRYNDALLRLNSGDYGCCSEYGCGKDISNRRLEALPFATRCIDCQEARETSLALSARMANFRRPVTLK